MAAVATAGVNPSPQRTYTSAAAQSRGIFVIQGASDGLVATAGANAVTLGVVEESTAAGLPIAVTRRGDAVAVIGAAVTAGQFLKTNASGQVIPTSATADQVCAQALTSGSTAGDEILVDVMRSTI